MFIISLESGFPGDTLAGGAFFPYIVYISTNALFPLMALFVWLGPQEYRNYIPLYMAGKIIAVVLFFAWALFSPRELSAASVTTSLVLLGGSIVVNMADALSIWGAWALKNKYRGGGGS